MESHSGAGRGCPADNPKRASEGQRLVACQAARATLLDALFAALALPIADVADCLDVPCSTIDKLRAQGRGPRTFKIGRRLFVHQDDLRAWLQQMRDAEGEQ